MFTVYPRKCCRLQEVVGMYTDEKSFFFDNNTTTNSKNLLK